jgi:hypothetical protein
MNEHLMIKYGKYMAAADISDFGDNHQLYYMKPKVETDEAKVIRLVKGDFEKQIGMSFDRFQEILKTIITENPEKLI